jgi:hypothetical protein
MMMRNKITDTGEDVRITQLVMFDDQITDVGRLKQEILAISARETLIQIVSNDGMAILQKPFGKRSQTPTAILRKSWLLIQALFVE